VKVLGADEWRARRAAHERRVDAWVEPHLRRRRAGVRHPVEDFLFTYYFHRPAQLRRWHPGAGVVLAGATAEGADYRQTDAGACVDVDAVLARRGETVDAIRRLLVATAARTPYLGCFGLHEWAMVCGQRQDEVRHPAWPLRLSTPAVAALVHERGLRCSHFDAVRFFTPQAHALNLLAPSRETQEEHEQPGCLHANMDLYKWAFKLLPLVPSELVADCFELARDIRALDMRASPYDLAGLGYPPVRVETAEGRAEYAAAQRAFTVRAEPLRAALVNGIDTAHTIETCSVPGTRSKPNA
jgi:hypothetical protein